MPAIVISAVNTGADTLTATAHGQVTGNGPAAVFAASGGANTVPGGLSPVTDYWLIVVDANTVKLATSSANAMAGTAVDITSAGSGVLKLVIGLPYRRARTYATGVQIFSADLNSFEDDDVWLWNLLTGQSQSMLDGPTFAGPLMVGGQLYTFANFTFTADSTTDTCTATAHPLHTGLGPIRTANTGGGLPGGLAAATDYYAINTGTNTFKLATSRANAIAGVAIDLTSNGTGTQTLQVQATTTRIADAEVTRNLTVDGNLNVVGKFTVPHTKILSGVGGLSSSTVGTLSSSIIARTGASGGAYHRPVDLNAGDTVVNVRVRVKDASGTTVTATLNRDVDGVLTPISTIGTSAGTGAYQTLTASAINHVAIAGGAYAVTFTFGGTAANCDIERIEVDVA